MKTWNIYYGYHEYAREHGDPLLGTLHAETKAQAEAMARRRGMGGTAEVWAKEAAPSNVDYQRVDSFGEFFRSFQ